jgi:hypothetical protein
MKPDINTVSSSPNNINQYVSTGTTYTLTPDIINMLLLSASWRPSYLKQAATPMEVLLDYDM